MITTRILFVLLLSISFNNISNAQVERWQQSVKYKMDVDFLIKKHHANGNQTIEYTNNSPDTLTTASASAGREPPSRNGVI